MYEAEPPQDLGEAAAGAVVDEETGEAAAAAAAAAVAEDAAVAFKEDEVMAEAVQQMPPEDDVNAIVEAAEGALDAPDTGEPAPAPPPPPPPQEGVMDPVGDDKKGKEEPKQRVHRSLPRVKAILEDEMYLQGVLQSIEQSNCATQPIATASNAWMHAFESVYANVATDCHLPTGKNRHHKFKDKIVELWHTMEELVHDPAYKAANTSHPLYALGMKQLETYRSVATDQPSRPARKTKAPSLGPDGTIAPRKKKSRQPKQGASGFAMDGGGALAAADTILADTAETFATAALAAANNSPGDSGLLLQVCQNGFSRLEQAILQQLPPKLPSPLQELHRLYLQVRGRAIVSNNKDDLNALVPYYRDAVTSYLNQVTQQTNNSAHPALLHTILEGIDQLRQGPPPADLENTIRFTYKHVMTTYLKLIHPRLDTSPATPGFRVPAAKRTGGAKDQDKDEGGMPGGTTATV